MYKEYDRRLRDYFANGIDDEFIIEEITRDPTALQDTDKVTSN